MSKVETRLCGWSLIWTEFWKVEGIWIWKMNGEGMWEEETCFKGEEIQGTFSGNDDVSLTGSGMLGTSHGQHQGASDRSWPGVTQLPLPIWGVWTVCYQHECHRDNWLGYMIKRVFEMTMKLVILVRPLWVGVDRGNRGQAQGFCCSMLISFYFFWNSSSKNFNWRLITLQFIFLYS